MREGTVREGDRTGSVNEGYGGWAAVSALALAFLLYGLLMFFAIGDKGPPDWDFGTVEDVPGQSVYSTSPSDPGTTGVPEPQHVSGKPSEAEAETSEKR